MNSTNIGIADYLKMPGIANEMREEGRNVNKQLLMAAEKLGELSKVWHGVRYDKLVESFNQLDETMNQMLDMVVDTIPFSLQQIAHSYASVDVSSTAAPTNEKAKKIAAVALSGQTTLRFVKAEVEEYKNQIFKIFNLAIAKMNAIEVIFNTKLKAAWQSEAADAYAKKFAELKNQISEQMDNIKNSFDRLVAQTIDEMNKAEAANTVH